MRKDEFLKRMDWLATYRPDMDAHFTMAGDASVINSLHPSIADAPDLVPNELALDIIIELFDSLDKHPIKTAESFRNAALGNGMFAINPLLKIHRRPDVDALMEILRRTIADGRMIDFGFIPNEVLKAETLRARDVFEAGELQHPYEGWLGVSAWEGGMCGYFYIPLKGTNQILAIELYGIAPLGKPDAILVNDIVSIEVIGPGETRIHPFAMIDNVMETDKQIRDRGANLLDPLVTFLRLLADASIPVIGHPAPDKLNKRRVLQGKFPIPAHTRVETRDYVSMIQHPPARSSGEQTAKGGHHASPVAHWRRAHQRHLVTGRVVPVKSSKVNWRDTQELHRLFYRVPTS